MEKRVISFLNTLNYIRSTNSNRISLTLDKKEGFRVDIISDRYALETIFKPK